MRFSVYHPKWNDQQFPGEPHMLQVPLTVPIALSITDTPLLCSFYAVHH
jgi:hypothetical protein